MYPAIRRGRSVVFTDKPVNDQGNNDGSDGCGECDERCYYGKNRFVVNSAKNQTDSKRQNKGKKTECTAHIEMSPTAPATTVVGILTVHEITSFGLASTSFYSLVLIV